MQFHVLGPLEVIADGGPVALPAAKHRALLAALLVRANQAVPADGLIESLWDGRPPAKTLQTYVSQLRRELEPAAAGGWRTLQTVDGGYRLRVDPDRLDATRFERLAEEGRRALGRAEAASAAAWLREGLELWRGPAYGELAAASFARAEAARLEELRLAALEWRVEAELALGGHAQLVGDLEDLVRREPFRERLWGQLMLALYRSGRQAEALGAYRRLRGSLADHLGIDPAPELRRLEERILRQEPSLDPVARPPGREDGSRLPPVFAAPPQAPLVGRDAELERLRGAWAEARTSGPRLVVVSGEPGIGKSRLAAELARLVLADGGEVLVGHADEEPMAPYQPFMEALGQHEGLAATAARLPEAVRSRLARLLPAAVPGATPPGPEDRELDRFQLLAAVAALLAELGRASPLLLVLEDLHWADRATLAMLLHLARSPERAPLLVVATARDGGLGVGDAWVESLAELRRHRLAELVAVRALDDGAVGGLVAGYLGQHPPAWLAAAVGRAADRNPFFVEELLRNLVETGAIDPHAGRWPAATAVGDLGVPEGVRQVLARRLARLSALTAELLQVAAVAGREFEFTLLGRMTGWEDAPIIEAVEEALRAGVLSERGSSWVAAYSFRHALVREALYGDLSLPRRQGLHLRAAAAIEASGPLDASGVAGAALHLRLAGPLADQARLVELSLRACEAASAVYAWDEAVAHLRAALEALERTGGSPAERARIAERLGVLVQHAGTDLEEGIGYVGLAMGAVFGVRTEQVEAASRRALELAGELGDESMAGWACYLRAWWAFNRGRLAESLSLHERMRDTATRLDDVRMGAWAAFGRAILSGMYLADPRTARGWCAWGLALPRVEAFPRQRGSLLDHLGQAKGGSGELAEARRIAAGLDPDTLLVRMLRYWSGDWEQAEAAWAAASDRDARSGDRLDGTLNAYWLGRVRRLLGADQAAEVALAEGLAVALQGPQVPAEVLLRAELSLLAAGGGRLEAARAELARCQELIGTGEDWRGLAGRVALAAGTLAAADGRPGEAGEAFAVAVATFRAHACSWDEAEARCLWARALPADADRQRETAAGLYRRMGAGRRWTAWAAEPAP